MKLTKDDFKIQAHYHDKVYAMEISIIKETTKIQYEQIIEQILKNQEDAEKWHKFQTVPRVLLDPDGQREQQIELQKLRKIVARLKKLDDGKHSICCHHHCCDNHGLTPKQILEGNNETP